MLDNPFGVVKDVLETEVVKAGALKPFEEIGNGFADLFYSVFTPVKKWKIKNEYIIQKYEEEIKQKYLAVPEENRLEPKLNIVGPALEASKYYIEEEEIRTMFSNLIASSMNAELESKAHPAFVEIIKQLSVFDAKIFTNLFKNRPRSEEILFGIGAITLQIDDSGGSRTLIDHFFPIDAMEISNSATYIASIDNLIRLGLLTINFNASYTTTTLYDPLINHDLYKAYVEQYGDKIKLNHGTWDITTYGRSFATCCI